MPKVYSCQIWLESVKGDYNAAAVDAARKLKRKQISALSGTVNYESVKFINWRISVNGNRTIM